MKELINAINSVMEEATNVAKNSKVGKGTKGEYDGLKDVDVKQLLQPLMAKNELAIFQTGMEVFTSHDVWEQTYNGNVQRKKQVFTEVKVKYTLYHSSGQKMEICGLGYGVDSQDKGAGKAQTYALKMALVYLFLIPVGDIDDTDNTHSKLIETPLPLNKKEIDKVWLSEEKLNRIIEIGSEKISQAIMYYDGRTVRRDESGKTFIACMKKDYKEKLTNLNK